MLPILLILFVLSLLLLALLLPVEIRLLTEKDECFHYKLSFCWPWSLPIFTFHSNSGRPDRPPARSHFPATASPTNSSRIFWRVLRQETPGSLGCFLSDLIRSVEIRELTIHARIGIENPADTGMLYALFAPLRFLPPRLTPDNLAINLEPDFVQEGVTGMAAATFKVIPFHLLRIIASFILKRVCSANWRQNVFPKNSSNKVTFEKQQIIEKLFDRPSRSP